MPKLVTFGAMLQCTFGVTPSPLTANPGTSNNPTPPLATATIMHNAPLVNIMTFGMCQTPSNPAVAAATTAALGVFTPAPCVPATVSPWTPGSFISKISNIPALTDTCILNCTYGGVISIKSAGQVKTDAT